MLVGSIIGTAVAPNIAQAQVGCPAGGGENGSSGSGGVPIILVIPSGALLSSGCQTGGANAAQYADPSTILGFLDFPFIIFLPDSTPPLGSTVPNGAVDPVKIQITNGSNTPLTISSISCVGGSTSGIGTTVAAISLGNGASCALNVGAAGGSVGYSGATLSRSGSVYTVTAGTLSGGVFGGIFIPPDTTPPTIVSQPGNISVSTDAGSNVAVVTYATPTFSDNVGVTSVNLIAGLASGSAFPIGVTTITHRASDAAGNTTDATFTVTVGDNEPPIVTVPANITTEATSASGAAVTFTPTASDNVAVTSLVSAPASGDTFAIGMTSVTVTAQDSASNSGTGSFTVKVQDTTAPMIAPISDIMTNTDPGLATAVANFTPTATDAVGVTSLTSFPASGTAFALGTTLVTVTAKDAAGNTGTTTFNVIVKDSEQPIVNVPANIAVNTDPGLATAAVSYSVTFSDNAPGATLSQTAGLPSGSNFPIGTTTNTFLVTDAAGNTSTASFTVTVTDSEPPVIVGLPSDITVDVSFPGTSAVVTYSPPTVTDNAPGATIVRTAGLASGANFPAGITVVTYTATDAAGNSVSESFNVTVKQIPPGEVIVAVVSDVSDGTFNFSSPEPQFNFAVTTSGSAGQSPTVTIKPGTHVVTASLPSGFGLTGVTCSDADNTGSVSAKSATINLQSAEKVTCTFRSADSRTKTTQAISRFLKRRNDLLLSSEPNSDRQIARLNGRSPSGVSGNNGDSANFSSNPSGLGASTDNVVSSISSGFSQAHYGLPSTDFGGNHFGARAPLQGNGLIAQGAGALGQNNSALGTKPLSFSTSLLQLRQKNAAAKKRRLAASFGKKNYASLRAKLLAPKLSKQPAFDVWAQGRLSYFNDKNSSGAANGHFGVLYLDADYVVNTSFLIGALVQFDDMTETSDLNATRIRGNGWMVGPYATVKLTKNLYFQARAAWGRSNNDISPFLTYTDSFDTQRWLVRGKLKGVWNSGAWQFSPSASVAYIEEHQEGYVDSLNVTIPDQTVSLGQAAAGPEVSYRYKVDDGFTFVPRISLKGVWNFTEDNSAVLAGTEVGASDIRGRAEIGLKIVGTNGASLDFAGSYDGIGDNNFQASGGRLKLRLPLN